MPSRARTRLYRLAFMGLLLLLAAIDARAQGELIWHGPQGDVSLPVLDVAVEIDVRGPMLEGRVLQTFTNPLPEAIEALYVFPLPEDAAVHHMELRIGSRRIVAAAREREKARHEYERARAGGRKAALVESDRPNLFRMAAANIAPGERIEVELAFVQELVPRAGFYELAFPLTLTPRFTPGASLPGPSAASFQPARAVEVPRVSLVARIDAGAPLASLASPSHGIVRREEGAFTVVEPEQGLLPADRDFVLRWETLAGESVEGAFVVEDAPDASYAMAILHAPDSGALALGQPTESVFVIDVSGSMDGPSLLAARASLDTALARLRPGDAFNVVAFAEDARPFFERLLPATAANVAEARRRVRALACRGGTDILAALEAALSAFDEAPGARARRIVFLTDGAVGNEDEVFAEVAARLGVTRLHAIGIGNAPNRHLMRKMAAFGHGLTTFIADGPDVADELEAFLARVERPLLTDLQLRFEGAQPIEVIPARLPDLHAGEPLVVSLRFAPGSRPASVSLEGVAATGPTTRTLRTAEVERADSSVALRWARARIERALDGLREGVPEDEVRREVVALGTRFNLATRYTSLVAVEAVPGTPGDPRSVRVPNGLPRGMSALPRGGTLRPLLLWGGLALSLAGLALLTLPALLATGRESLAGARRGRS